MDKPKRPVQGIKDKDDLHPNKPGFDSREHYENTPKLHREIRKDTKTYPKAPRMHTGDLVKRIEDLEELVDVLMKPAPK